MPGPVIHVGATVMCMHAGVAQPMTVFPRVLVSGQPIATQTSVYAVVGCGLASVPSPPCVTGQWVVGAFRVKAGGAPVIVQGSQAICAPTGTGLIIGASQTRVVAT